MVQQKKTTTVIEGFIPRDELDSLFDMAMIFSGNAIVHLKGDTKEIKDVVVGDELLGWRGEYRKVKSVYRPKYFKPTILKYGIGAQVVTLYRSHPAYVEVGEQTKVAARNYFPAYDPVPTPKKARELLLHRDSVEVCQVSQAGGGHYAPGIILKITQKSSAFSDPYLIGIEGNYLVVNDIVVTGCDIQKINLLIEKEKLHEQHTKKKARIDASENQRLRECSDGEELDIE